MQRDFVPCRPGEVVGSTWEVAGPCSAFAACCRACSFVLSLALALAVPLALPLAMNRSSLEVMHRSLCSVRHCVRLCTCKYALRRSRNRRQQQGEAGPLGEHCCRMNQIAIKRENKQSENIVISIDHGHHPLSMIITKVATNDMSSMMHHLQITAGTTKQQ